MSNYYSVFLPVKSYILKFVQAKEVTPLKLDGENLISIILWENIDKTAGSLSRPDRRKYKVEGRTDNLELLIPIRHQERIGKVIHQTAVLHINKFLENYFEYLLVKFIDNNAVPGCREQGYRDNYFQFTNRYGIEMEVDIAYDALRIKEWRLRKQMKTEGGSNIKATYYNSFFNSILPAYQKGLPIFMFGYKY